MPWTLGREVAVGSGGTSAATRTYTLTNGAAVPVGNVLILTGGNVTNLVSSVSSTTANAGALSSWVPLLNTDGASGTYVIFAYAAVVLGALTNTDTVAITFAGASTPLILVRDFSTDVGLVATVALDKSAQLATFGAAAGGSWSSGACAAGVDADPLHIGVADHDNGAGTSDIASLTLAWNVTTTGKQGPIGSMMTSTRWRSPGSTAGEAFAGTSLNAATDWVAGIAKIKVTTTPRMDFARPDADVTDGGWTNEVGSNVNLYASIDEAVASDTDLIQSGDSPATHDVAEIGLSNITP